MKVMKTAMVGALCVAPMFASAQPAGTGGEGIPVQVTDDGIPVVVVNDAQAIPLRASRSQAGQAVLKVRIVRPELDQAPYGLRVRFME